MNLDSSPNEAPNSVPSNPTPSTIKMNKNLAEFLAIGKEIYFASKAVLRSRVIYPDVKGFAKGPKITWKVEFSRLGAFVS